MRVVGVAVAVVLLMLAASSVSARIGVGIVAGDPTALNLRFWSRGHSGFDVAVGRSWPRGGGLAVYADYLYGSRGSNAKDFDGALQYYVGAGMLLVLTDGYEGEFGIRVPLGLDYVFASGRFDIFAEIAPTLLSHGFAVGAGLGVRYIF